MIIYDLLRNNDITLLISNNISLRTSINLYYVFKNTEIKTELLNICKAKRNEQQSLQKIVVESLKRNMVAIKFKKLYPAFPYRFIMSLPFLYHSLYRVTSYLDCIPKSILTSRSMCGIDVANRPLIVTMTDNHTVVIHGRYTRDLFSSPRVSGDREAMNKYYEDMGCNTVIYKEYEDIYVKKFLQLVCESEIV